MNESRSEKHGRDVGETDLILSRKSNKLQKHNIILYRS